jgi:integrase
MSYDLFDKEGYAVPFDEVRRLIEYFPYGTKYRVAIELIALTGCRLCEIERIGLRNFRGSVLVWKPGKNQKGYRKESLPKWFMDELDFYLRKNPHSYETLFPFNGDSLSRYVNKIRKHLGGGWNIRKERDDLTNGHYIYMLKGLRHSFATVTFYKSFLKWGGTLAVEKTAKKMRHSSYKITAQHYIDNMDDLKVNELHTLEIHRLLKEDLQTKLTEFL